MKNHESRRLLKLNGDTILNESTIYHTLETDEGVWLCTDNGLFLVDPKRGVQAHIDEQTSHLPNKSLLYLHIDQICQCVGRQSGTHRQKKSRDDQSIPG